MVGDDDLAAVPAPDDGVMATDDGLTTPTSGDGRFVISCCRDTGVWPGIGRFNESFRLWLSFEANLAMVDESTFGSWTSSFGSSLTDTELGVLGSDMHGVLQCDARDRSCGEDSEVAEEESEIFKLLCRFI
jgi:hypothetical protein